MLEPIARRFLCARCRTPVLVCSHCDRGQIYCASGCAAAARGERQRDAARRYQCSRRGRFNHAARTRRWRERQAVSTRLAADCNGKPQFDPFERRTSAPRSAFNLRQLDPKGPGQWVIENLAGGPLGAKKCV